VKSAKVPKAGEAVGESRLRETRKLLLTQALDSPPVADLTTDDDQSGQEPEAKDE
jgi:hypothetical protein